MQQRINFANEWFNLHQNKTPHLGFHRTTKSSHQLYQRNKSIDPLQTHSIIKKFQNTTDMTPSIRQEIEIFRSINNEVNEGSPEPRRMPVLRLDKIQNSRQNFYANSARTPKVKYLESPGSNRVKISSNKKPFQNMLNNYESLKWQVRKGNFTTRMLDQYIKPKCLIGKYSHKHHLSQQIMEMDPEKSNYKIIIMNYILNSPDSNKQKEQVIIRLTKKTENAKLKYFFEQALREHSNRQHNQGEDGEEQENS